MNRRGFVGRVIAAAAGLGSGAAVAQVKEHTDDYYDKYWDAQRTINELEDELATMRAQQVNVKV